MDDMQHGEGEYFWPDGTKYKGGWVNGKKQGRGVYCFADGEEKEGEWDNDELISGEDNQKNLIQRVEVR